MPPQSAAVRKPFCPDGVRDQASTGSCIPASSVPVSGLLLPLGNFLFVSQTGNVGIGTTSPGQRLKVQGMLQTLSGGLRFSDGSALSTATLVGPPGIQGIPGPQGSVGPPGLAGPQGPITAMPSVNQREGIVTIAAAGSAKVTSAGSVITIGIGPNLCSWGGKTYSPGARCWSNLVFNNCGYNQPYMATLQTCQTNGNWSAGFPNCYGTDPALLCGQ